MSATLFIAGLAGLSIVLSAVALWRDRPLNWTFALPETVAATGAPDFRTVFDYTAAQGQAHAPAVVIAPGGFQVIWFEGSAEAQADVDLFAQRIGPGGAEGQPKRFVTRDALGDAFEPQQLVVTLGNAIQNDAGENRVYATVVSVGGWAMAAIADVAMGPDGPKKARKLNLSPLLNRSHLVKAPMLAYDDGAPGLPAYFEMGPTYGELVRLGPGGRVRDVRRIPSKGVKAIQPMIVPLDEDRAVAFLRDFDASRAVWISRTQDGGQSWSMARRSEIANPGAPVAALNVGGGRILAAMNDAADNDRLRLVASGDGGQSWHQLRLLEEAGAGARYPMLRRLATGEIALAYSQRHKRGIRVHVFNQAWVEDAWPKN